MAEKKVSVRLSVEGSRQVRAELEGVGTAGAQGFGRLSTEMELANTRLASFARKAGLALAAVAAAAAAAGVAMIRSGLETVDAQAKLARSLGTTVASIQTLVRPNSDVFARASSIEGPKHLLSREDQGILASSGWPIGECRLNGLGFVMAKRTQLPAPPKAEFVWQCRPEPDTSVSPTIVQFLRLQPVIVAASGLLS